MGHEERFPQTRMSDGCGFRKETIAGMRRNGRDAPKADVPAVLKSDQLSIIKPTRVVRPVLPVGKTPTELPLPSGSPARTFSADLGISEKSTKSPPTLGERARG